MRYFIVYTNHDRKNIHFYRVGGGLTKRIENAATYTEEQAFMIRNSYPAYIKVYDVNLFSGFEGKVPVAFIKEIEDVL